MLRMRLLYRKRTLEPGVLSRLWSASKSGASGDVGLRETSAAGEARRATCTRERNKTSSFIIRCLSRGERARFTKLKTSECVRGARRVEPSSAVGRVGGGAGERGVRDLLGGGAVRRVRSHHRLRERKKSQNSKKIPNLKKKLTN